jgi:outer membrane protein OmpU
MNTLKKLGLSALAGSLAAFSAQAGELSVSGSMEATYTSKAGSEVTGNPIGTNKAISFKGSHEFDNGWSANMTHTMLDTLAGISSSVITFNLGSLGKLGVGQGDAGYGIKAIDNVMPTAYEEADHGMDTGLTVGGAIQASGNHIFYQTPSLPVLGTQLDYVYIKSVGSGAAGDGATATGTDAFGSGQSVGLKLIDAWGFTIGGGASEIENLHTDGARVGSEVARATYQDNPWEATAYVKYAWGPITVGYQMGGEDNQETATASVADSQTRIYGISFNVNDDLSVSYQRAKDKYHFNDENRSDASGNATEEAVFDGWSIAYNMGPAAIKFTRNTGNSVGGTKGTTDQNQELSISVAF